MKKGLLILIIVIAVLAIVWFSTAFLQKPPKNPLVKTNFADYKPDYTVSKEELIQDVDFYTSHVDEMHAAPYKMISKQDFLRKADEVKDRIRAHDSVNLSVFEAYYHLQEIAASIQDGHTRVFLPWKWDETVSSIFPIFLTTVEGRFFVQNNFGENDIPIRAEILAINDTPLKQMMEETIKYVDATLPHFKRLRWASRLLFFIHTYYKMPSPWQVSYIHEGARTTASVKGIDKKSLIEAAGSQGDYKESEFSINGESVPLLELTGFGFSRWGDFQSFINDFFSRHKDKKHLVIDVRQHPGGSGEWGFFVLDHVTDSPFKINKEFAFKASATYKRLVQYFFKLDYHRRKIPRFMWSPPLYKVLKQDNSYYWINRGVLESETGSFYDTGKRIHKTDEKFDRFKGKVFVLTSHPTFSAGAVFAAAFKNNNMGVVVGRETGGRLDFLSDARTVEFPHSRLRIMMPVAKLVLEGDPPDRGVLPDVQVEFTPEDYINQKDRDIERVKELIRVELEK